MPYTSKYTCFTTCFSYDLILPNLCVFVGSNRRICKICRLQIQANLEDCCNLCNLCVKCCYDILM